MPEEQTIMVGRVGKIHCSIGNSSNQIIWVFNGQLDCLPCHQLREKGNGFFTLLLTDVTKEHAGIYTCLETDMHGQYFDEASAYVSIAGEISS